MKEYQGSEAKKYKQTKGKRYILIPAIDRYIAPAKLPEGTLLDIGCGRGDFAPFARRKGYQYYGCDASMDMIALAQQEHSWGHYACVSATECAQYYNCLFDVILISMLFPAMKERSDIVKTLEQVYELSHRTTEIIIGVTHPSFDHYMQKALFNLPNVRAEFKGYHQSGAPFTTTQKIEGKTVEFHDYHWIWSDYVNSIIAAGFTLINVDECILTLPPKTVDHGLCDRQRMYPSYVVFLAKKNAKYSKISS